MARKGSLIVGAIAVATVVTDCSGQKSSGVFAVRQGMTRQQVRALAGMPQRSRPSCWLYRASKNGTSIVGRRFCFTNGRVSLIQSAVHGATVLAGEPRRAELALVRSALAARSGILAPFRPARLGRKPCRIPRGGPTVRFLPGVCETRVVQRVGERLVILSESWSARDFRGSGAGFRKPDSRPRLRSSWLIAVSANGTVRHTAIRGDFPPQLVF